MSIISESSCRNIHQSASVERLQTGPWPQPRLCQTGPAHRAAAAVQRKPAATHHHSSSELCLKLCGKLKKKPRLFISHTSLMMVRLVWSRPGELPACLRRRFRAFSLSSQWAAALLWDLWISCRWHWRGEKEKSHPDVQAWLRSIHTDSMLWLQPEVNLLNTDLMRVNIYALTYFI